MKESWDTHWLHVISTQTALITWSNSTHDDNLYICNHISEGNNELEIKQTRRWTSKRTPWIRKRDGRAVHKLTPVIRRTDLDRQPRDTSKQRDTSMASKHTQKTATAKTDRICRPACCRHAKRGDIFTISFVNLSKPAVAYTFLLGERQPRSFLR